MTFLPDIATLRLCSALASTAFALIFAALWYGRRGEAFWLYWGGSCLLYALTIAGFAATERDGPVACLYAALGLGNALILAGVRQFDRLPPLRPWMALLVAAPGLGYALPLAFAAPEAGGWLSRSAATVALAASMGVPGVILLLVRPPVPTRGRRIAGAAMLGYMPAYGLGVWAEVAGHAASNLTVLLPMLADQLLLSGLNLGLMAMPGERAQAALRAIALTDPLTGALNRAGLTAHTAGALAPGTGVVVIDVDHFKAINDRFGHASGDAVLSAVVAAVRAELPRPGDLVARLGGDEFVAILHGTDLERARAFAETVGRAARLARGTPPWTVSLGVAMVEAADRSLDAALARADRALYAAKAAGRGRAAA